MPAAEPLLFKDTYEVIRRIASGGMGEIYLARQRGFAGFERLVILKTLLPELAAQTSFVEQFLDEARVAATLNHPNVVAILEVGQWSGVYFIAMEYINGEDLSVLGRVVTQRNETIPHRISAAMIRDAALGLDHAHHARSSEGKPLNIVHRDISPQNIMVRDDGVIKVVDFGIAKATNRSTNTTAGILKGKLRYMSPEQIRGEAVDGRTDQYALGITLWKLTIGTDLYDGDNPMDVFKKILKGLPAPPRSVVKDYPKELESILTRMLSVSREDRFDRCMDVATAIDAWLKTQSGPPDEVSRFVNRVVGDRLLARKKDLSPQPVSIQGLAPSAVQELTCPRCGHKERAGKKFCGECGLQLVGTQTQLPVVTPPPKPPPVPEESVIHLGTSAISLDQPDSRTAVTALEKEPTSLLEPTVQTDVHAPAVDERPPFSLKDGPLVGRDEALAALGRVLAHALQNRFGSLILLGEHGMGKTRLLDESAALAAARGMTVMRVSGARGMKPLEAIAALLGNRSSVDKGVDKGALREAFMAAARERPLCMLIDGIDRIDEPSVEFLVELSHAAARSAMVVVGTAVAFSGHLPPFPTLELPRLSTEDVVKLTTQLLSGDPLTGPASEHLKKRAAGNPLLVRQFLQSMVDAGDVEKSSEGWRASARFRP